MDIKQFFPVWDQLTASEQRSIEDSAIERTASKGTVLHNGSDDCVGLFLVQSGRLRAYIMSDEGKEVTLYRLFDGDICLFSASCMIQSIQFDIIIKAETDSTMWMVPADVYKGIMDRSAVLSGYTNQIMASRFSEVMWLVEQIMWKSFDKRLAAFLINERSLSGTDTLTITHEQIASHLGTAREVVTRMLRYFKSEGMLMLSRGTIELTDVKRLAALAES